MLNTHLSSACNDKKKLLNHENVLNQINYASFFFFFFFFKSPRRSVYVGLGPQLDTCAVTQYGS